MVRFLYGHYTNIYFIVAQFKRVNTRHDRTYFVRTCEIVKRLKRNLDKAKKKGKSSDFLEEKKVATEAATALLILTQSSNKPTNVSYEYYHYGNCLYTNTGWQKDPLKCNEPDK